MSRRAKGSPWIGCLSVRKARVGIGSVALPQRLDHQYYCAPIIHKSRAEKKQVTTLVGCLATQQLPSDNHFVICGPKLALVLLTGKWLTHDIGQRHRAVLDDVMPLGDRAGIPTARRGSLNPEIVRRHETIPQRHTRSVAPRFLRRSRYEALARVVRCSSCGDVYAREHKQRTENCVKQDARAVRSPGHDGSPCRRGASRHVFA